MLLEKPHFTAEHVTNDFINNITSSSNNSVSNTECR